MPLEDLPDWLPAWCVDHLGGEPAGVLFRLHQVSMVFGLRLADGRSFTPVEQEIAWAASLWMAAYNVWEAPYGDTPVPGDTLRARAAERLRRAHA